MKKTIVSTVIVAFVIGLGGVSFAGQGTDIDFFGEGMPEKIVKKNNDKVYASKNDCIDLSTFYSEGGNDSCKKGVETKITPEMIVCDFNCEGRSEQYQDIIAVSDIRRKALHALPAAGN